jgi:hypothetical protein
MYPLRLRSSSSPTQLRLLRPLLSPAEDSTVRRAFPEDGEPFQRRGSPSLCSPASLEGASGRRKVTFGREAAQGGRPHGHGHRRHRGRCLVLPAGLIEDEGDDLLVLSIRFQAGSFSTPSTGVCVAISPWTSLGCCIAECRSPWSSCSFVGLSRSIISELDEFCAIHLFSLLSYNSL